MALIARAVFVIVLLLLASVAVRRRIAATNGGIVPDEGVTIRNVIEVIVEGLAGLAKTTMGPEWRKYFPFVGAIFFFILIANLIGLDSRLRRRSPTTSTPPRRGRSSRTCSSTTSGSASTASRTT